jgi:hypothetical protein
MSKRKKRGFSFPITTLAGSSLPNFIQLRKDYNIDPKYFSRFLASILVSAILEPFRWWEDCRWGRRVKAVEHKNPPVFIIGFWRSGTTMLHEMLCLSDQASFVTTFQTVFPNQLLSHSWWLKPLASLFMPSKRPFDNLDMDLDYPQEEEIALANVQLLSFYNYLYFPKNYEKFYHRDLFFENATEKQLKHWERAYKKLIAKAMINRPGNVFISKNPSNMARIEALLQMFPEAKFIFIYRNPYKVVESFYGFFQEVMPAIQLQSSDEDLNRTLTARLYAEMLGHYYKTKDRIPAENLIEIRYEDMISDPGSIISTIYEQFGLKGFERQQPLIQDYLERSQGISVNHYDVSPRTVELVNQLLVDYLKRWKYEVKH